MRRKRTVAAVAGVVVLGFTAFGGSGPAGASGLAVTASASPKLNYATAVFVSADRQTFGELSFRKSASGPAYVEVNVQSESVYGGYVVQNAGTWNGTPGSEWVRIQPTVFDLDFNHVRIAGSVVVNDGDTISFDVTLVPYLVREHAAGGAVPYDGRCTNTVPVIVDGQSVGVACGGVARPTGWMNSAWHPWTNQVADADPHDRPDGPGAVNTYSWEYSATASPSVTP